MTLFLTESELYQLTDCQKQSKQAEWLNKRGWIYEVSRLGRVKVLRKYAEMKLGIPSVDAAVKSTEPDFSRL